VLEVIEDDHDAAVIPGQRVQQLVDSRLDARPRHPQSGDRTTSESGPNPVDRVHDIRPQPPRVIVTAIERDPRGRMVRAARKPEGDQHSLPSAGRTADHRQLNLIEPVERDKQSCSRNHARADAGLRELRLDQRQLTRYGFRDTFGSHLRKVLQGQRPWVRRRPELQRGPSGRSGRR